MAIEDNAKKLASAMQILIRCIPHASWSIIIEAVTRSKKHNCGDDTISESRNYFDLDTVFVAQAKIEKRKYRKVPGRSINRSLPPVYITGVHTPPNNGLSSFTWTNRTSSR